MSRAFAYQVYSSRRKSGFYIFLTHSPFDLRKMNIIKHIEITGVDGRQLESFYAKLFDLVDTSKVKEEK